MNLGKESKSSFIESQGISILKRKIEKGQLIKARFAESDRIPNTDGFFVVINAEAFPEKVFDVQIKCVENLVGCKYSCDTKFINYANLKVTENPCIIFVVDVSSEKVFFKYLSEQFLKENNFLNTEQKNVTLHFSATEILDDISIFYALIKDIIKEKNIQTFSPQEIDIIEYQTAYDILNNFFDNDFANIKKACFPKVWKFGIAYEKISIPNEIFELIKTEREKMGITAFPYATNFGVYAIEYGNSQNIFQNINAHDYSKLDFRTNVSWSNCIQTSIEQQIRKWLNSTILDLMQQSTGFVKFMPNEALFEIIYNFIDSQQEWFLNQGKEEILKSDTISSALIRNIIYQTYSQDFINFNIKLLKSAIDEIVDRKILTINRIWEMPNTTSLSPCFSNDEIIALKKRNIHKLFLMLPKLYDSFVSALFTENVKIKYNQKGIYHISLDNSNCLITKRYKLNKQGSFQINFVEQESDLNEITATHTGAGIIKSQFNGTKLNIYNNLLSLLYSKICEVHGFESSSFNKLDADF